INNLQSAGVTVSYVPQYSLDSDGDGMPDDWEIAHGLNPFDPTDAAQDKDGDGLSNLTEYALGTDPRNPGDADAALKIALLKQGATNFLILTFVRRKEPVSIQYVPEVSTDGVTWYSDAAHVGVVGVGASGSQFDWVTNAELAPVLLGQPGLFRLKILQR
ncbi:MAG TPA: hypothetical protein VHI52_09320, partial [Verrucomicrobiae bacterium]|nr:hypothetical protein [Verrucomicrobiae bacterium]